jgi:hypothetical protein
MDSPKNPVKVFGIDSSRFYFIFGMTFVIFEILVYAFVKCRINYSKFSRAK